MNGRRPTRRPDLLTVLLIILGAALAIVFLNRDIGSSLGIPNDDFVRVAALVAILIFVGAGVLGGPMGVSQIIRSLAAWAVIILLVVGLYASRDELAGFAGRMLGALVPGLPVTGQLAGQTGSDSVVITRARNGHFGVRALVDGMPTRFLVDTGASVVTLTYEDALRVGIDAARLNFTIPIRTASGMLNAAAVTLNELTIGPIARRRVRALVAPRRSLGESLLGLSFLDTLASYTIAGDRMVLTP